MSQYTVALRIIAVALALATIVGLTVRRRVRACVTFLVYLVSVIALRLPLLAWPERFWTWEFTAWTDAVQTGIKAGIAFEIAYKVFRPLPVAYLRMRVALLMILSAILGAFLFNPTVPKNAFEWTLVLDQVSYGTAFLFVAFALLTRYYCVPVDPLHRAITTGGGVVCLLEGFVEALSRFDPPLDWGRDFIVKTTYPVVLAAWCASAWRRDVEKILSPATMRRLQPWRAQ